MVGYRICPLYCNKNVIISSQFHFLEKKKNPLQISKTVHCRKFLTWKTCNGTAVPSENYFGLGGWISMKVTSAGPKCSSIRDRSCSYMSFGNFEQKKST